MIRIRTLLLVLVGLLMLPRLGLAEVLSVLVEEKARETFGATLPDAGEFEITLQGDPETEAIMLSAFWMDASTGQFVANAVLPDGSTQRIAGLALLTVPVPVPVRNLMPDEILTEADLEVVRLASGRVGAFAVLDSAALVGMQVRRLLSKGRPIMSQSVIEPLVIDRGDLVSIRFRDGALELSAPGRALADAHLGQPVKIVNLVSNASVVGVAAGKGLVEVRN
ncbi:MAG: flagellar basal body P-ring formation chaperone FlgA [Tranquillimonas sp.]|jgi:flagella basal body P-ring formation protein FlgA